MWETWYLYRNSGLSFEFSCNNTTSFNLEGFISSSYTHAPEMLENN
jgi:hypothetical protein